MPDHPGSTRCHYGPSRSQHGRYTDRPGLPRTKDSSRTVTDDPGNFKHFKTSVVVSRTMPVHDGPWRTIPDHPGLSRITTDPTRIWPRIGKISVRDGPGRWCDCRLRQEFVFISLKHHAFSHMNISTYRKGIKHNCSAILGYNSIVTEAGHISWYVMFWFQVVLDSQCAIIQYVLNSHHLKEQTFQLSSFTNRAQG